MKTLNSYLGKDKKYNFGDYLLFQEYSQGKHNGKEYEYTISKPILAIFISWFPCDQTIGFEYVKWFNNNRLPNGSVEVYSHIEWSDYIDVLGHWAHKPSWKEILSCYRKQNLNSDTIEQEFEIDWMIQPSTHEQL